MIRIYGSAITVPKCTNRFLKTITILIVIIVLYLIIQAKVKNTKNKIYLQV